MGQVIKKHFKSFLIIAFFILVCNLLNALHPFVIKQIDDLDFNQNNIFNILLIYFVLYLLIHFFLVILRNVTNIKLNKTMAFILRDIRDIVFKKVLKFKEKCTKDQSAKNITKAIYEFLINENIDKKLKIKAKELEEENEEISEEYKASFNTVIKILDEIVKVFGEEKITFDTYTAFLKISFSENGLGKIPAGLDQVTVGDVDRSRSHKVKVIFIIGVNDRKFPKCK